MHWVRYLPQEVSIFGHYNHQSTDESREVRHPPVFGQQLQAAQAPDTQTWTGSWSRWNKWYRQEHSTQDLEWKAQAKPW
jgi:hypothetical protein